MFRWQISNWRRFFLSKYRTEDLLHSRSEVELVIVFPHKFCSRNSVKTIRLISTTFYRWLDVFGIHYLRLFPSSPANSFKLCPLFMPVAQFLGDRQGTRGYKFFYQNFWTLNLYLFICYYFVHLYITKVLKY